jgi:8-oxo-dGTP pyrophosphatase MutT (NUDIX family)
MFLTKDHRALFLQRSSEGDHGGEWCLPGGKVEKGENLEAAARRECEEELGGKAPAGPLSELTRTRRLEGVPSEVVPEGAAAEAAGVGPPLAPAAEAPYVVDFTTFAQKVDKPFEPVLDAEHVAYAWVPVSSPPMPLHPGVAVSLRRLNANELDVAEMIRDGLLVSGQAFHGMTLVAMRITGTGLAYRKARKEYVWRKPDLYLNERFLQRCNGLPVIMEHPKKTDLNSAEFQDRVVGVICLPYIVNDEVWGIAKIYDDATVKMLRDNQLSTSPSVVFRNPNETNTKLIHEDGSVMLVEGDPQLLDHLAICPKGVWDKGGEPRGIAFETIGDSDMTDEEKKTAEAKAAQEKKDAETQALQDKAKKDAEEAERKKADAEAGEKRDKVLTCLDSVSKRMDAYDEKEKARADAEAEEKRKAGDEKQIAMDKAKKDADEKMAMEKSEKDRKDAEEKSRKDSEDVRAAIKAVQDALPKPQTDEDLNTLADCQMRADSVMSLHGQSASRPLPGETPISYRRRSASALKAFSPKWKDIDLAVIHDSAFENVESMIYADAEAAGNNPVDIPVDVLRPITRRDVTGRQITTFQGRPGAWMKGNHTKRKLLGIRNA